MKGAMGFAAGVGAFLLFFLSDYNDWRWSRRSLRVCFPLGVLLLTAGTAWEIWQGTPPLHGWLRGAAVLLAVFFFGLLVYTLFFALPVEASYARPGEERGACTTGVYALCRHPGVLWFAGLYGCLWAAGGLPLWKAAVLSGSSWRRWIRRLLRICEDSPLLRLRELPSDERISSSSICSKGRSVWTLSGDREDVYEISDMGACF